nr:tRNA (adenosine(37)-N6)-threonylcarbamoyltransferase complex ATPase subunit type 1 TsaE [Sedimentibacter sp.]
MKIKVCNLEDTKLIGKIIARNLLKGTVLCLDGDLGAGKTTLTQFIAQEFGVDENITSPTFTIIKEYEGVLPLYHMDVYRIDSDDDMYDLGYEEYIYSEGVCIIEWSQKISNMLPMNRINIYIQRTDDENMRIFLIEGQGHAYNKIIEELKNYENTCN